VLLFDRGDLRVQLAGAGVRIHWPDIGVEIVGLILGGHDRCRMQLGDGGRLGAIVVVPQIVLGCPMLIHGRPAWQDIRMGLQNVVCILTFQAVQ
jgi:hypothetical protein